MFIADTHGKDVSAIFKKILIEDPVKAIFVGDFVDSFDEDPAMILYRLKEIIKFAHENLRVTLILGNHDLQYLFLNDTELHRITKCSGFNQKMAMHYHLLFKENLSLFRTYYMNKNLLVTHAGISNSFFTEIMGSSFDSMNNFLTSPRSYQFLLDVGKIRGGSAKYGGPFWAHKSETYDDLIPGIIQVVGHTAQEAITSRYYRGGQIYYFDLREGIGTLILDL